MSNLDYMIALQNSGLSAQEIKEKLIESGYKKNVRVRGKRKEYKATKQLKISHAQKKAGHMSTKQVAKFCKVKLSTVRGWVQKQILKPVIWRQGGAKQDHYFDKKEVMELHLFRETYKALTPNRWIVDFLTIIGKKHTRSAKYLNRKMRKDTAAKLKLLSTP